LSIDELRMDWGKRTEGRLTFEIGKFLQEGERLRNQKPYVPPGDTGLAARRHRRNKDVCLTVGNYEDFGILGNLGSCYMLEDNR